MVEHPRDLQSAVQAGREFGVATAERTASAMSAQLDDEALKLVGLQGIAEIIGHAHRMIDAGLDRDVIVGWLDNAAEAFSAALDLAIRDLKHQNWAVTVH